MYSIPAVEGRLLQFPGDRLHAVPRPHDVYWTHDVSGNHVHTPPHQYERSVLLFNLWDATTHLLLEEKVLDCGCTSRTSSPFRNHDSSNNNINNNRTTCYNNHNNNVEQDNTPERTEQQLFVATATTASSTQMETNHPQHHNTTRPFQLWKSVPVVHRGGNKNDGTEVEEEEEEEEDRVVDTAEEDVHDADDGDDNEEEEEEPLSLLSLLWDWIYSCWWDAHKRDASRNNKKAVFQVPLSGDAKKRGMDGYVARMQSTLSEATTPTTTTATTTKEETTTTTTTFVNVARENLRESHTPMSVLVEVDDRFAPKNNENDSTHHKRRRTNHPKKKNRKAPPHTKDRSSNSHNAKSSPASYLLSWMGMEL